MNDVLASLRRRQRSRQTLVLAGKGLFYGCLLAAVTTAVALLVGWTGWIDRPWLAPLVIAAVTGMGALLGLIRRIDDLSLARALDRAAGAEDRFASAMQLSAAESVPSNAGARITSDAGARISSRTQRRVKLVMEDALSRVRRATAQSALPLRTPREIKWLPVPLAAIGLLFWLAPGAPVDAHVAVDPEVTADQWRDLHEEFTQELADMPEAKTPEEKELADKLERLAELLKEKPEKKEALAEIAKLREELEKRRQESGMRDVSMRKAAESIRSSQQLKQFGSSLRQGDYKKAADELKKLAEKLKSGEMKMAASDFEATASDFDRMADELKSHEELSESCRKCANAANSMNRDKLSDAMKQCSSKLSKNADKLKKCDSMCKACNSLDSLRKRLSQCKSCSSCKNGKCQGNCSGGQCNSFVRRSDKKGGLKAGWGTANNWDNGSLAPGQDQRLPDLTDAEEQPGESTTYSTVSPDERAAAGQDAKQVYAEMVRKAESDLNLDTVPLAYRDYLRQYFVSIRPQEDAGVKESDQEPNGGESRAEP